MLYEEVTSSNAYKILNSDSNALVIDVRTDYEWQQTGIVAIKQPVILLSWRLLPNMIINHNFLVDFEQKIVKHNTNLFFICRSGGRSQEAALYIADLKSQANCYNIIDGFEGNNYGAGWIKNNLPINFIKKLI